MGADDATDGRKAAMYRHRTDTLTRERGSGPAVVCSPGTFMDRTMFDPQLDALADDYRVVAHDWPARTDNWEGPYDVWDMVEYLRVLLDALDVDSCVHAGLSVGGFVGLRFAMRYPECLDGLVIMESMAGNYDGLGKKDSYETAAQQIRDAGEIGPAAAEIVAQSLFGETTHEENSELVECWQDRWASYPGEAVYQEMHAWLDMDDVEDRLDEIDVPVLVVHGDEDISVEPERSDPVVERVDDARREMIEGAGHTANLEKPEQVNRAMQDFLADVY